VEFAGKQRSASIDLDLRLPRAACNIVELGHDRGGIELLLENAVEDVDQLLLLRYAARTATP